MTRGGQPGPRACVIALVSRRPCGLCVEMTSTRVLQAFFRDITCEDMAVLLPPTIDLAQDPCLRFEPVSTAPAIPMAPLQQLMLQPSQPLGASPQVLTLLPLLLWHQAACQLQ